MSVKESNILKGMGIVLMYIHHLFYLPENFAGYDIQFAPFGESLVVIVSQMCKVCVAIFVFATAYGITKTMNQKFTRKDQTSLSEYYVRRYVKLMSGFWFIWGLAQITSFLGDRYTIYGDNMVLRIKYMIIDFFGVANVLGTPTLNATWWYMGFAILLIFVMPILWMLVKKIGWGALIIALFLPVYIGINMSSSFAFYLFTIVLGILLAENGVFERMVCLNKGSDLKRILIAGLLFVFASVLLYMRWKAVSVVVVAFYDGIFTLLLCMLSICLSRLPLIGRVLEFIGVHSMNMFLTHTFIKAYYFQDFSYSWKYPGLILLVLLLDTLLLSVLIEKCKKIIGYHKLFEKIIKHSVLHKKE